MSPELDGKRIRKQMRSIVLLVLGVIVITPAVRAEEIHWKSFGCAFADSKTSINLGQFSISVSLNPKPYRDCHFPEDCLLMRITYPEGRVIKYPFYSSYGTGKVALVEDLLLLEVGIGRGTYACDEHVKGFVLGHPALYQVFDVDVSGYFGFPIARLVKYSTEAFSKGDHIKLVFRINEDKLPIPQEMIVIIKKGG